MINCYTFYSYKGGSGRSTTAVNTVRHLADVLGASPEHPILVVDADLESAGLTYFFGYGDGNCYTDLFNDTIHTTKIILKPSLYFDRGPIEKRLFTDESAVWNAANDESLLGGLSLFFTKECHDRNPDAYSQESVRAMLDGVMLGQVEIDMLKACCASYESDRTLPEDKKRVDKYKLSLVALGQRLKTIHNDSSLSDTEKAEEKKKAIKRMLPATSFKDISSHFAKAEGTVKFLGVDVDYEGEQIVRGVNTVSAFSRLVRKCEKWGYCAIIFDSGAGVQSTAEAFHKISDVLVYCMRPTKQFRSGTRTQLANHKRPLEEEIKRKKQDGKVCADYKPIVLLPTAVPMYTAGSGSEALCAKRDEAIEGIKALAKDFATIVDSTFCDRDGVLNEVEVFKWEERILLSEEEIGGVPDQLRAFRKYRELATRLSELSRPCEDN